MKHRLLYITAATALLGGAVSCNKFLDTMPDNRTELDTEEKIVSILVSAYPDHDYQFVTEIYGDNTDEYADNIRYTTFHESIYRWTECVESNNESTSNIWSSAYDAIANANQALAAIEVLEAQGPISDAIKAAKGEALVCRAFGHFILVNVFCMRYDPDYPDDLGIPYMTHAETSLAPKYERGTVIDVYKNIEKDLIAGLPLIDDSIYTVPKYHFNKRAAYAFAARFFLYYEKFDKAIEMANEALGTAPANLLRDNVSLAALPTTDRAGVVNKAVCDASLATNFLITTGYSSMGMVFGGSWTSTASCNRFNHSHQIGTYESVWADAPYGSSTAQWTPTVQTAASVSAKNYTAILGVYSYNSAQARIVLLPRCPNIFQYTDLVAGTGYRRSLFVEFTADECLLDRAEAYILTGNYEKALEDLNLWAGNTFSKYTTMTEESIVAWRNKHEYYKPFEPTPIKELNPHFTLADEKMEAFAQAALFCRRFETMHMGRRLFDVKRYGMKIFRRTLSENDTQILEVTDSLTLRDPRRAIQIPVDVIAAGLEQNPRDNK